MAGEEKASAEKEAVASMKSAMANMTKALSRIQSLESALKTAAHDLDIAASYISETAFAYRSETRLRESVKDYAAAARKAL